jgi:predicted RNA binding protein YcfA (HicA-like mRNA interferase family)
MADPLRREPIRRAVRDGWSASLTRGGHVRLDHPSGAVVFTGATPSDYRIQRKLAADLRRELRRKEAQL